MAKADLIPIEYLRECFDYDPETGVLTWHARPLSHFVDERARKLVNTQHAGKPAGCIAPNGYARIVLRFSNHKWNLEAHRIAFGIASGQWPSDTIDHKNGRRADNRLSNLRPATASEQQHNRPPRALVGAHFNRRLRRWYARIKVNWKHVYLGSFDTPEEAHAAYLKAKAELHPFQPVPR